MSGDNKQETCFSLLSSRISSNLQSKDKISLKFKRQPLSHIRYKSKEYEPYTKSRLQEIESGSNTNNDHATIYAINTTTFNTAPLTHIKEPKWNPLRANEQRFQYWHLRKQAGCTFWENAESRECTVYKPTGAQHIFFPGDDLTHVQVKEMMDDDEEIPFPPSFAFLNTHSKR